MHFSKEEKRVNNLKRKILNLYIILSLLTFILCIVFAISFDMTSSLLFLVMFISCIIIYFISKYLYLTWLGKLQYIFIFIPLLLAVLISKTELYFNLSIYDFNNILINKMKEEDEQIYDINYYKIIDSKDNTVLEFDLNDFDVMIQGGKVEVKEGKVGYKIEFEDKRSYVTKCIVKDINNNKYEVFDGICKKMSL